MSQPPAGRRVVAFWPCVSLVGAVLFGCEQGGRTTPSAMGADMPHGGESTDGGRERLPEEQFQADASIPEQDAGLPPVAPEVDRVVLFYTPHGTVLRAWRPEPGFELGPILDPLEPFKDRLTVLDGLDLRPMGPEPTPWAGTHAYGAAVLWTGAVGSRGQGIEGSTFLAGGPSLDQVLGGRLGATTPVPILNLAYLPGPAERALSSALATWVGRDESAEPLVHPRSGFERAFAGLAASMPPDLAMLRETVEALPATTETSERFFETYMDVVFHALALRRTRVITMQFCGHNSTAVLPWIHPTLHLHALMHRHSDSDRRSFLTDEWVVKLQRWYAQQLAGLAARLDETPSTSGGSLLDHTLIVWMSETSETRSHSPDNIPVVLIGNLSGKLASGQHLEFGDRNHVDLLLTLAQAMGVPLDAFGDGNLAARPIEELLAP